MTQDKIDAILTKEEELIPSSGFLARVMERVEEEAAAPPPIPFPWKRFLPGFVLAGGVLGWGALEMARYAVGAARGFTLPSLHGTGGFALSRPVEDAGWVAGALLVSAAAWMLSRRLAGRSGLL